MSWALSLLDHTGLPQSFSVCLYHLYYIRWICCSLSGDSPIDGHISLSSFSTMNVNALMDIRGFTSFCAFVISLE